jgi:soluble cytochrome b562
MAESDLIGAELAWDGQAGARRPARRSLRRAVIVLILATFAAGVTASSAEPLAALIARAEAARMEARPPLYTAIAERQLLAADELYNSGKVDEALAAVRDVVTYSDKAHDAASHSGKQLKNTEIQLRKMAVKLRDIKRSVSFEEQAAVQDAADHLEHLRSDLLTRMFGMGEKM